MFYFTFFFQQRWTNRVNISILTDLKLKPVEATFESKPTSGLHSNWKSQNDFRFAVSYVKM